MPTQKKAFPKPDLCYYDILSELCKDFISFTKDQFFTGSVAYSPSCAIQAPLCDLDKRSVSDLLFHVEVRKLQKGLIPIYRSGTQHQASIRILRPTWILETVLNGIYNSTEQTHILRPGSNTDFIPGISGINLTELTHYLYWLYERTKEATLAKGHWSAFIPLLNDHTYPLIYKEIKKRVSPQARVFVIEHSMRLHLIPKDYFEWVKNHALSIVLSNERPTPSMRFISENYKRFLDTVQVY